jgi:hypothetical protein
MKVMIPELHEKLWTEKDRWGRDCMVFANEHDEDNKLDKLYKERM